MMRPRLTLIMLLSTDRRLIKAVGPYHAFFAALYRTAGEFVVKHFLSGVHYASESVVPPAWGHPSMDGAHVRGAHARFGNGR